MRTLVCFTIMILFLSCSVNNMDVYQLYGKIYNTDTTYIKITVNNKQYCLNVDSSGNFVLQLKIEKPIYLSINDDFNLYANPGDKQDIRIFKNAIFFSGDGKEINEYLLQKKQQFTRVLDDLDYKYLYSLSPNNFKNKVDSLSHLLSKPLKKSIENKHFDDKEFVKCEMLKYKYLHYYYLSTYCQYSCINNFDNKFSSNSYFSFISYADFSDETLLQFKEYKDFIVAYTKDLTYLASLEEENKDVDANVLMKDVIEDRFSNIRIKEYVISQLIPQNKESLYKTDEIIICKR